ncbi:unnamed protein product [Ectocarpus sp. CCAP 1310/34]|nr:unnamed protein product [Ectocarpus sp. CCAP 1310/34]
MTLVGPERKFRRNGNPQGFRGLTTSSCAAALLSKVLLSSWNASIYLPTSPPLPGV